MFRHRSAFFQKRFRAKASFLIIPFTTFRLASCSYSATADAGQPAISAYSLSLFSDKATIDNKALVGRSLARSFGLSVNQGREE